MRHWLSAALAVGLFPGSLGAQGTPPKEKPADYPVSATAGPLTIAADYLVRSFGREGAMFWTPDYLVVEVALYSAAREPVSVAHSWFTLKINGKKEVLMSQPPGLVAASIRYSDWEQGRRLEVGAGAGDAGVVLGRPTPQERFPGDGSARQRLPPAPRAPAPDDRTGLEREPARTAPEMAVEAALPEGAQTLPVAGYVYFPFKGKPKSIRTLELLAATPEGAATLKLK
jgi:hypothetical protein